jgi:hypothetical protein
MTVHLVGDYVDKYHAEEDEYLSSFFDAVRFGSYKKIMEFFFAIQTENTHLTERQWRCILQTAIKSGMYMILAYIPKDISPMYMDLFLAVESDDSRIVRWVARRVNLGAGPGVGVANDLISLLAHGFHNKWIIKCLLDVWKLRVTPEMIHCACSHLPDDCIAMLRKRCKISDKIVTKMMNHPWCPHLHFQYSK